MNWLQLQRLSATGSLMSRQNHRREWAVFGRVLLVCVASMIMMISSQAFAAFGAPCSTACPSMTTAMCPDIYCKPASTDPEISCDDWCANFAPVGSCANCGACPEECNLVCGGVTAACSTPCEKRSGASCVPTTCGAEGITPPACFNSGADIPNGAPYACCANGSATCTCQDVDYVDSACVGNTCTPQIMGSGTERTGCMDCTNANQCLNDICAVGGSETCEFGSYNDGANRACYTGPVATAGIGLCKAGTETCKTGVYEPCTDVTPVAEVCDGLDNDCDGTVDNGTCTCTPGDTRACYGGSTGTENVGECKSGSQTCSGAAVWGACMGDVTPAAEVCDNRDNDCDSFVDGILEFCYSGPPATEGVGRCKSGWRGCEGGSWNACTGEVLPALKDSCGNGIDDDCNGLVDDGCPVMSMPEICDGLDNDGNGLVDDGAADADCPAGQICEWGTCFDDCTTVMCMGAEICYVNDFRCDDAVDPCTSVTCPSAMMCFAGSCYDACTSSVECDPTDVCYLSGRCTLESDPCDDVQCPESQICYAGGCFDPCADDAECMTPDICLDGRCTSDACFNVDCPVGTICAGGSCFQTCSADSQCDPNSQCYNGRCAADNCQNIACPKDTSCFGGFCADSCLTTATCAPGQKCFQDTVNACIDSSDPCKGVECGTSELCFAGSCFTACSTSASCGGSEVCYAGRCADNTDPQCDKVLCPLGESCFAGTCSQSCSADDQCDPSSYCYQGTCVVDSCTGVTCPSAGDVCHRGVCYQGCDVSKPCVAPDGCFDGRCAPSACEAQAATFLLNYNNNHPFRKAKKRLRAYQEVTPWIYGRAFSSPGLTAKSFMSSAPAGLYRTRKARVVLYRDASKGTAPGEYALYLTHGGTTSQGSAEAVYSMQFNGTNPDVLGTLNDEKEAYWVADTDPRHISALITTNANKPGGVLIGHMRSDQNWRIKITATLHGDLDGWEFVNGETGEIYQLDQNHPLLIRSEDFASSAQLSPEIGTPCLRDDRGLCAQGTYLACENSERVCGQTVFPATMEFCDGVDNDCDGAVDENDPDLRVPMVSRRQGSFSGWRTWISFDTAGTSRQLLDYTPSLGDDRLGSTAINLPGFGAIQDNVDQSHTFAHRDLRNGRLTFPFIHGKQQAVTSWETRKFEFDGWAPVGSYLDDMYIAWYEDRKPGSTGDQIVDEWYRDFVEMDLAWEVVMRDGMAETDGVVLGVDWYGVDAFFNLKWDFYGDDDDEDKYDWFVWSPGAGSEELHTDPSLRVRIQAARLDETACQSPNSTVAGCEIGRYTCRSGVLSCSNASDLACNACVDSDGDGAPGFDASLCPSGTDCNDDDATVGPNQPEMCNGLDDNCDGIVDITTVACPSGAAECGPAECNFVSACVCPDGPEDESFDAATMTPCYCGEGLTP